MFVFRRIHIAFRSTGTMPGQPGPAVRVNLAVSTSIPRCISQQSAEKWGHPSRADDLNAAAESAVPIFV